ncbi:hypothetical protein JR316_0013363 [Psilocybe cubensis]|uniref:SET domain-containing protein n=2 Tax=Psilocybe cubensis TaxID=181762 RepID=A0A8H7XUP4_PSICU|nr:hypothetical protein JR316_0013363 [Psilocybe cubensis]KAH9474895.1 hypothetical protein JR316_0013363 [Psilocybe cubensis]
MKRGFLNGNKVKQRALYPLPSPNANSNSNISTNANADRDGANINSQMRYTKSEAHKTDHSPASIVFTTIPPRPDPDGQSEWIALGDAKKRVLGVPGYPRALPSMDGESVAYEVRDAGAHEKGMGLGVFATRDIDAGALIFAERPLLVIPVNSGRLATSDSNIENTLAIAVGRMRAGSRDAFMQLANCHNDEGPLLGIVRTNGWIVRELSDEGEGTDKAYTAICKIAARINHSCMPNIHARFDLASFAFYIRAARGIKAGEQLFHSYCSVNLPLTARRAALAPYAFTCACHACTHASPTSDTLRREFATRVEAYRRMSDAWVGKKASKKVDEGVVRELEEFRKELVSEGLDGTRTYGVMLSAILRLYMNSGRIGEARVLVEEMRQRQRLEG